MSEKNQPKRDKLGPRMMREVSVGPVDKSLEKRAEWMVESAMVQKYLHPKIKFEKKDPTDVIATKVEESVAVLSIGAGKGHEMDEMDMVLPGSTIMGIDPHDYQTRPVKKRLDNLAHDTSYLPKAARAENLQGVEDESIDGVTLFFVMHHVDPKKYEEIMSEIDRVLKEDGYLFVAEDLVDSEEERQVTERVDRLVNVELTSDAPHTYKNMEQWQQFFKKHGFRIVESEEQKPKNVRHGFFVLERV